MTRWDISLPHNVRETTLEATVESSIATCGLIVRLKTSLTTIPGSVHWHTGHSGQRGVLEITLTPATRQIALSTRRGRDAPWIPDMAPTLIKTILHMATTGNPA
jgi:hypothetical protein